MIIFLDGKLWDLFYFYASIDDYCDVFFLNSINYLVHVEFRLPELREGTFNQAIDCK